MDRYPEKCVQVRVSNNFTQRIRENGTELPCGLVIFGDRVGTGLFDTTESALGTFIDTDDPAAMGWAIELYDQY